VYAAAALFRLRWVPIGAEIDWVAKALKGCKIDIGRWSPTVPVTPPYMRVRIRRFGGLNYGRTRQVGQLDFGGHILTRPGPTPEFLICLRGASETQTDARPAVLSDHRLHPLSQPVKPAPHVRLLRRQPDAHGLGLVQRA